MKSIFHYLLPCMALFLLIGCGSSKRALSSENPPLAPDAEIVVLELNSPTPPDIISIGHIKTKYSESSTCATYDQTLEQAIELSRSMGGNLIKITKHVTPHPMMSWHRIWADVYRVPDDELTGYRPAGPEFDQALFDEGCAIIYFYRAGVSGWIIDYNVKIGEEVLWRAQANRKEWVKVKAEGLVTLSARTEAKTTLDIDIQPGRVYYVKCGIGMGIMVGRPTLDLVNESTGKYEFDKITK